MKNKYLNCVRNVMWKSRDCITFRLCCSLPPLPFMAGVNNMWQEKKKNCFVYWCHIGWSFPFLKSLCFIFASIFFAHPLSLLASLTFWLLNSTLLLFNFFFLFSVCFSKEYFLTSLRFIDFDFSGFRFATCFTPQLTFLADSSY